MDVDKLHSQPAPATLQAHPVGVRTAAGHQAAVDQGSVGVLCGNTRHRGGPDGADVGEFAESFDRKLAAVSAELDTAEG